MFQKNNKYGGRKQGSVNKVNKEIREAFTNLLNNNLNQIENDLKAIKEPERRVKLFLELAQFCLPKLRTIDAEIISTNIKPLDAISIFNMTDDEIEAEFENRNEDE